MSWCVPWPVFDVITLSLRDSSPHVCAGRHHVGFGLGACVACQHGVARRPDLEPRRLVLEWAATTWASAWVRARLANTG